jgi:3-hydroxyisobutyrate dehydrogenase
MGMGAALSLVKAGHEVHGCDLRESVRAELIAAGGHAAARACNLPDGIEAAVVFVVNAIQAETVLFGQEGCLPRLAEDGVVLCCTTVAPEAVRQLGERVESAGRLLLDAPVSGGTVGAEKGTLAIMAGADEAAWSVVEPVMSAYAQRASLIGPAGAGQLTKMSNQICVAGIGQALAEGLAFAEHNGLDPKKVLDVMLKGSSTSWMMENRAQTMIDGKFDFGFSTTLMRKDLGLVMEEANRADVSLPVTALVGQLLSDVSAMGLANADWCSLMQRQRRVQSGK